jgi:hypothetical protein
MDHLPAFARYFGQLVWLLVHRADHQDEQKDALRLAVGQLAERRHELVLQDVALFVAGSFQNAELKDDVVWLSELSIRMSAHWVRAVEFEKGSSPGEVLGLARALAAAPVTGDEGAAFDAKVVALAPTRVAVHIGKSGFVRRVTPPIGHNVHAAPARTPVPSVAAITSDAPGVFRRRSATPAPNGDAAATQGGDESAETGGVRTTTAEMLARELSALPGKARDLKDLLGRIESVNDSANASIAIDNLARDAEDRGRQGLSVDVAEVLYAMHQRHDRLHDGDLQRAFRQGIRRLEKPVLMMAVAQLLPRRREMREKVTHILARAGDVGAEALIDQLVNSDNTAERKAYRTALAQCPAAVPALLHLLHDERWYVVRNAVELLGELAPPDAEGAMANLLTHGEPRVRRSAAAALAKVGTPRAVLALLQAVPDSSPDVRKQVAIGLGAVRNPRAVPWLIEALDKEQDPDVQGAMLAALGRMPTDDSIARLTKAVTPGGMLLRKSTTLRLHAVEALGEAGTPAAHSVLRSLQNDRDRVVREAAGRALDGRGVVATDG